MKEKSETSVKQNFKITVIFKDEIITQKFSNKNLAMATIKEMRTLFPELFISGSLEERKKRWEVIWTLGLND